MAGARRTPARAVVGISGFDYPRWRGVFYPEGLPGKDRLAYASRVFGSIELNGTFYSLKSPAVYRRWAAATPEGFVFAIKGSRYITHSLRLKEPRRALANFLASGVLALGARTGPFLWQLPPNMRFDRERLEAFLEALPRSSAEAEPLARRHDKRVPRAQAKAAADVPYRHCFEPRHESFFVPDFYALLKAHRAALVVSDSAGKFPTAEVVTCGFMYVRLHGSTVLYTSAYTDEELDSLARKARRWMGDGCDVFVYFDNDAKVEAPSDARRLSERLGVGVGEGIPIPEARRAATRRRS